MTENKLNRKKLKAAPRNITAAPKAEEAKDVDDEAKGPGDKAADVTTTKRMPASDKRLASFLSHFKRECGS